MFRYALALILLAGATISRAQKADDRDYKLGVNVELVQLPVSVLRQFRFRGAPLRRCFTKNQVEDYGRLYRIWAKARGSLAEFSPGSGAQGCRWR